MFKFTVHTQQQCTNISVLLWQLVTLSLENLESSIQRYEVQSAHFMHYGITCYLQDIYKNILKL